MKSLKKYTRFGIHLGVIVLLMLYELLFAYCMGTGISILYLLPYYVPSVALFYLNIRKILPLWNRTKWAVCGLLILGIIVHSFLFYQIDVWVNKQVFIQTIFKLSITNAIFRSFYITGISISYAAILSNILKTKELAALKIRALEYENEVLRTQVQPHQIFNTHNLVYAAVKDTFPKQAKALVLSSQLIRNSFTEVDKDGRVPLAKEIDGMLAEIELYQMLHDDSLHVLLNMQVPPEALSIRIPVAILTGFVLDVFKHGDLSDPLNPARIDLSVTTTQLKFHLHNKKAASQHVPGLKIGLNNTKKRLEHIYPKNFDLIISDSDTDYTLNLNIKL